MASRAGGCRRADPRAGQAGRPPCDALNGRLRLELRATWLGGIRILNRIERQDFDVLAHRASLGATDVGWLAWRVVTWVPR